MLLKIEQLFDERYAWYSLQNNMQIILKAIYFEKTQGGGNREAIFIFEYVNSVFTVYSTFINKYLPIFT